MIIFQNILAIEIIDNFFDMKIGDSIAVDGICLTVKEIFQNKFTVDVSEETLKKTTLGLKSNMKQIVNLEPAVRVSVQFIDQATISVKAGSGGAEDGQRRR